MDEQQIQRLLQLKRYECSPSNDVEQFILEFQRRQRMELLQPSFLQIIQERLAVLFAEFQVPKMAYVTTTALAAFAVFFILHSENFKLASGNLLTPPGSYKASSGLNQDSYPITIERAAPLTLDINSDDRDDDSVVFPLSYILEKNSNSKRSPLIF